MENDYLTLVQKFCRIYSIFCKKSSDSIIVGFIMAT